ncbi:MAG: hypothetical protein RLY86_2964 [Pseudomonadota bacterium]|jgi:hypothetical protein
MNDESKPRVELIHRPNKLRAKVGGTPDGKPGRIDPAAIERAHTHVSRMSDAHRVQTKIDLTDLQAAYRQALEDPANRPAHMRRVFKISDAILTLGKTFGYDLLSIFAHHLNAFIVDLENPTPAQMQVVALHIEAMNALVRDEMKGDGGLIGKALAQSLAIARAKHGKKPA